MARITACNFCSFCVCFLPKRGKYVREKEMTRQNEPVYYGYAVKYYEATLRGCNSYEKSVMRHVDK